MAKENDILVCTKEQRTGCGLTIIHEGAIVLVVRDESGSWIRVYKSLDRKNKNIYTEVKESHFRLGDEKEKEAFYNGIRNVSELCQSN